MRAGAALVIAGTTLALTSCRAVVDAGVDYNDCERHPYTEEFSEGTTLKNLYERCWQVANADEHPSDVFVAEGDLVVRVSTPASGTGERWDGDQQGPMAFQALEADFVAAIRVEAVNAISGDHCLAEGNMAGLVVRARSPDVGWATFLTGPDMQAMGSFDCKDDEKVHPTLGVVRSRNDAWGDAKTTLGHDPTAGIGNLGEADLAVCRLHAKLVFYYRDPGAGEPKTWFEVTRFDASTGPMDVGLAASGWRDSFEVEGHFTHAILSDGIGPDGCQGALERLVVPLSP